jgi:hypothetical protein
MANKPDPLQDPHNALINASTQNQGDVDNSRYAFANTGINQNVAANQTAACPYIMQSNNYQSNSNTNYTLNSGFVFNQVPSNGNLNQSSMMDPSVFSFAVPFIPTTFNTQFPILQPLCYPQLVHNVHPDTSSDNQSNRNATKSEEGPASSSFNAPLVLPSKAKTRTSIPKPNFAVKLMEVLSMEDCQSAIQWMPAGNSFCILNAKDLVEKALAKHFKETKYSSFVRAPDFIIHELDRCIVKLSLFLVYSSPADSKAQ